LSSIAGVGGASVASPSITVVGLGERLIAYDILAGDVLELPGVAPTSWVAVLEPEDLRRDVRRHVLDDRTLCAS
jgi:hypothetical protein